MSSENWRDHGNVFGYTHEVQPQKVAGGAFAFVGFVVAGVYFIVRRYSKRKQAIAPVSMTPREVSALIVAEAVEAATAEYVQRTGGFPKRRNWFSLRS
jgi:hypothetical protein